ncbi:unnamed protein product [Ixodes pacificus]
MISAPHEISECFVALQTSFRRTLHGKTSRSDHERFINSLADGNKKNASFALHLTAEWKLQPVWTNHCVIFGHLTRFLTCGQVTVVATRRITHALSQEHSFSPSFNPASKVNHPAPSIPPPHF